MTDRTSLKIGMTPSNKRGRVVHITDDMFSFLMEITQPSKLPHDAPLPDFIRNNVLEDIREKIIYAKERH